MHTRINNTLMSLSKTISFCYFKKCFVIDWFPLKLIKGINILASELHDIPSKYTGSREIDPTLGSIGLLVVS